MKECMDTEIGIVEGVKDLKRTKKEEPEDPSFFI